MPKNPRRVRDELCDSKVGHVNSDMLSGHEDGRNRVVRVCDARASEGWHAVMAKRGVPLGMHRMNPEHVDPDPSDRPLPADVPVREQPEDEEEDEDEDEHDSGEDEDADEGYSE